MRGPGIWALQDEGQRIEAEARRQWGFRPVSRGTNQHPVHRRAGFPAPPVRTCRPTPLAKCDDMLLRHRVRRGTRAAADQVLASPADGCTVTPRPRTGARPDTAAYGSTTAFGEGPRVASGRDVQETPHAELPRNGRDRPGSPGDSLGRAASKASARAGAYWGYL
ncbi:hypothetical protein GCM10017687_12170 [Streptomyces echinatus]